MVLFLCRSLLQRGFKLCRVLTKPTFSAPRSAICSSANTNTSSTFRHDATSIVYLRGLPWKVATNDVTNFLSDCNIVNEEKGVHLVRRKDGRLTGECYVELHTSTDVEKAKAHNREFIGKRCIQVFDADRNAIEEYLKHSYANLEQNMFLCIQGFPKHVVTKDEIIRFFEGQVEIHPYQITLSLDEYGTPSGEGFIEFASEEDRQRALNKNNEVILGKRHQDVKIFECSQRDKETRNSKTGHMVLMRGLPFEAMEEDVRRFLAPLEPLEVRLLLDRNYKSKGVCEVDFSSHEGAVDALSKEKQYMGSRYIDMILLSEPGLSDEDGRTKAAGVD